jgi:hypothetical protein
VFLQDTQTYENPQTDLHCAFNVFQEYAMCVFAEDAKESKI